MELPKARCISQDFDMQPPADGHHVLVQVREPIDSGRIHIVVHYIGPRPGIYGFIATPHEDGSDWWTLEWETGITNALISTYRSFLRFAEVAFENAEAIRNSKNS